MSKLLESILKESGGGWKLTGLSSTVFFLLRDLKLSQGKFSKLEIQKLI